MLSYDWLKIVGIAAALIIVWMLIFTMTATRITAAQQFTVFNYVGNVSFSGTDFPLLYSNSLQKDVLSYEVIELTNVDVAANEQYAATLMEARLATNEGDVIFVADVGDERYAQKDENGEITYEDTYLESLVRGYGRYLYDLDPNSETGYFQQMENYLNAFYQGDWTKESNFDEAAVKDAFLARIQKTGDKRFKKQAEIDEGIAQELVRVEKYRDALEEFYGYLDAGIVSFTTTVFSDRETDGNVFYPSDGIYSINICPTAATQNLKNYVGYYVEEEDEDGNTHTVRLATNMNVAFFDLLTKTEKEAGFQGENLLFLNHVIQNSLQTSSDGK